MVITLLNISNILIYKMSNLTPNINDMNVMNIRHQINAKKGYLPHHTSIARAGGVLTDYDSFPYNRWYRGIAQSPDPIVAEREAGWRPRQDNCYKIQTPNKKDPYPNHCFESATNVVYPCYPEFQSKWADKEQIELMLNKSCIVQYR